MNSKQEYNHKIFDVLGVEPKSSFKFEGVTYRFVWSNLNREYQLEWYNPSKLEWSDYIQASELMRMIDDPSKIEKTLYWTQEDEDNEISAVTLFPQYEYVTRTEDDKVFLTNEELGHQEICKDCFPTLPINKTARLLDIIQGNCVVTEDRCSIEEN